MGPSSVADRSTRRLSSVSRPGLIAGGITAAVLVAVSGRYGYHRDELYFLACGRHLAFGYPDQPPLVPLLSRVLGNSLVLLRLPSALSAGAVVLLAGLMAQRLGAGRAGQWVAAVSTALCGFVLGTGHLFSTSTFDLLGWALITWLALREWWVLAGLVGGVTFEANPLVGFLLLSLAICRPRSRGPWIAGGLALLLGLPYIIWQARHGWPQLDVAHDIARGGSGSSVPRALLLPLLVLQIGPWLAPVWVLGLRRLLREPTLRYFGLAFPLLTVTFLVAGGKPYYLAGFLPLLLAAGAQPLVDVVPRWLVTVGLVMSLPVLVFTLPVIPESRAAVVLAVYSDAGETIGWPSFAAQVEQQRPALVITENYGQAGALQRFTDLPVYSGHNGYGLWGPPPGDGPALLIGLNQQLVASLCKGSQAVGRIHSPHRLDNDENGTTLAACSPRAPWGQLWPSIRHIG